MCINPFSANLQNQFLVNLLPWFVLCIKCVSKWLFAGGNGTLQSHSEILWLKCLVFIVCFRQKGSNRFSLGRNQSCPAAHTSEEHCLERYFTWCCFTQHYCWDFKIYIKPIERTNETSPKTWMNDDIGFQKSGEAESEQSSSFVSSNTLKDKNFKTKCCSLYVWGHT